jgi:P27 family predicted phage terminase small subunit
VCSIPKSGLFPETIIMARPRTPTTIKSAQGTLRPGRETPATAADALTTAPTPPPHLSPAAANEWKRLAPVVVDLGTLSRADLRGFELLCSILGTAADAEAVIKTEGMTFATAGGMRAHPACKLLETARAQAARLLEQFGLTPKARNYVGQAKQAATEAEKPGYFT